jgi:hypothetical protein
VKGAAEFLEFLEQARAGEPMSNEAVVKFAKLFEVRQERSGGGGKQEGFDDDI